MTVTVEDIQRDFPDLLRRVKEGETLVVVQAGEAIAEIKLSASQPAALRPFGLCEGQFTVPDDFDAPLPESIVESFER